MIDEIQRVPELQLSIKERVDRDNRPGRFLLTGSARVSRAPIGGRRAAGRIETLELYPFSQGEISPGQDAFVDAVFAAGADLHHESETSRDQYAELVVRGGFPEAVARSMPRRRERFLDAYVDDLIARDVSQIGEVERVAELRTLIRLLEGFVLMELARQLTWSRERVELFHYRTRDQVEVDAVLENRRGQVVGIEVKRHPWFGARQSRKARWCA